MITFAEVIHALSSTRIQGANFPLTEAVIDSRNVIPGSLFIALQGDRTDGHQFIEQAFSKGASAALVSKDLPQFSDITVDTRSDKPISLEMFNEGEPFCIRVPDSLQALQQLAGYWRGKQSTRVIGITGSVGKSSTKELITEVLSYKFNTYKNPGNYNNEIGLPLTILNLGKGYQELVLEMGFYYPGEISFLCEISKPDVGVITNIGTVHAERAGSQAVIAAGKSELVAALPAKPDGSAILNFDDPLVRAMKKKTNANVVFYGIDSRADIWADEIIGLGLDGIKCRLHYQDQSIAFKVPILGRHSVHTVLRAAAVGITEGMALGEIADALVASNSQLRLVAVKTGSGALVLDDTYNATPESTIAALDLLSELKGQKIAVLGDMLELGQYEKAGHIQVGEKAAGVVNHLITVGVRGKIIAETAKEKGLAPLSVTSVENALEAAELLRYNLGTDDVVLIKGSHGLRMDRISTILEASK